MRANHLLIAAPVALVLFWLATALLTGDLAAAPEPEPTGGGSLDAGGWLWLLLFLAVLTVASAVMASMAPYVLAAAIAVAGALIVKRLRPKEATPPPAPLDY